MLETIKIINRDTWNNLKLFLAKQVTNLFDLPEFIVCTCDRRGTIWYLYEIKELVEQCEWTKDRDQALLFYDINEIKEKAPFYKNDGYIVISYLDEWPDSRIQYESGYWENYFKNLGYTSREYLIDHIDEIL